MEIDTAHRRVIFVGNYGSGKTEVAVNFVRVMKRRGPDPVTIVDLDLVNPYFRSREAREELKKEGIRLVAPEGDHFYGELPIIQPEVSGLLREPPGLVVLDVGGDDAGATALASLQDHIPPDSYELWAVLNANRPFTGDAAGAVKVLREIEAASRLKVTGIVANTHLLQETDEEMVRKGIDLARNVARRMRVGVPFVAVPRSVGDGMDWEEIGLPYLPLELTMLRPWERKATPG